MAARPRNDFWPIVEPQRLSVGVQIKAALAMIKVAPGVMIGLPVLMLVVSAVGLAGPYLELGQRLAFSASAQSVTDTLKIWLSDYRVILIVVFLVVMILATVMEGACALATGRACLGKATTIGQGLGRGFQRLPALFGWSMISSLPVMAALGLFFMGLWRNLTASDPLPMRQALGDGGHWLAAGPVQAQEAGGGRLIAFGLLLLVPALLWTVSLAMAPAAIMLEGSGLLKALQRSWQLARTGFGSVLGRWMLVWLLSSVISLVSEPALGRIPLLGAVASIVLSGLVMTWQSAMFTLIYVDRRIDQGDLADQIRAAVVIDQAPAPNAKRAADLGKLNWPEDKPPPKAKERPWSVWPDQP